MVDFADINAHTEIVPDLNQLPTREEPGKNFHAQKRYLAQSTAKLPQPIPNEHNYAIFIRHHGALAHRFKFNRFTNIIEVTRPIRINDLSDGHPGYPRELTDEDVTEVCAWMTAPDVSGKFEKGGNFKSVSQGTVLAAIGSEARRCSYDPLKAHVEALPAWDHKPRLSEWLVNAWGVKSNAYHTFVARKMIIGQIARAIVPGIKWDFCPVFEGKQGLKKSTMCRILAGDPSFFNDSLGNMGSKEAYLTIQGSWLIELGELAAMRRSEVEQTKAFLTAVQDRYRPPYGRALITVKRRQCFIATTNETEGYLGDRTGNRRFLPVRIDRMLDDEWLKENRDQILAEALVAFKGGEKLYAEAGSTILAELEEQQEARAQEYTHGKCWAEWLHLTNKKTAYTSADILCGSLAVTPDKVTPMMTKELGRFMATNCPQWVKSRKRVQGVKCYVYEYEEAQGGFFGD